MDDINFLRTLVTVASFIAFVAIVAWAWSPKQRSRFNEAAQLPFADDARPDNDTARMENRS
ncbi:MAG: cbb3-type cytochrome c oxidase subunit 3 [Betaproteobacteria bacterium]|nr:cbb3-type cytochrome c oxidase subunit 3 [Betaproteobacteria bacterium]